MSATSPTTSDLLRTIADLTGTTDLAGLLTATAAAVDRRVIELEAHIDRLVTDLATAWGIPEASVRHRTGLGGPGAHNPSHRAVSADDRSTP